MATTNEPATSIPTALAEAIRDLPVEREVEHCGVRFTVSPFAFYGECPLCGTRLKLRAFSAGTEIEDVFDAFFEWMEKPGAEDAVAIRRAELRTEEE